MNLFNSSNKSPEAKYGKSADLLLKIFFVIFGIVIVLIVVAILSVSISAAIAGNNVKDKIL
jgi:hypothetical protein